MHNPSNEALALVRKAKDDFRRGYLASARVNLRAAFALREAVERTAYGPVFEMHRTYTIAMLEMAVLWYKLGNFRQGNALSSRAQAWADDAFCSNQFHYDRSLQVREHRLYYFLSGLEGWFWALVPG